jgi:hypothetical protein
MPGQPLTCRPAALRIQILQEHTSPTLPYGQGFPKPCSFSYKIGAYANELPMNRATTAQLL